MNQIINNLALGIPTYKRAGLAIDAIKRALAVNIYDQIIVSANSYEPELEAFIESSGASITYFQQPSNVGMALNYYKVLSLCECRYIHLVSDEDSVIESGLRELYSYLLQSSDCHSVIVVSIVSIDGTLYRDTSWQMHKNLRDFCGDSGHFGSSIVRVDNWSQQSRDKMLAYCMELGSAYPTAAAAAISYANGGDVFYFRPPLILLGAKHAVSEMGGYAIYGYGARLHQYIAMLKLVAGLNFNGQIYIYWHLFYFFTHHAFRGSIIKYNDRPLFLTKNIVDSYHLNYRKILIIYSSLALLYVFVGYYKLRAFARRIAGKLGVNRYR